jgi:hypothetical protein
MKQFLDRFILAIPLLFIKQFPYAWIALIALWTWPPVIPGIFLLIIVLGLLLMRWQSRAWISNLRREHAFKDGKFHIDEPSVPWLDSARKIVFLLAGSALIAWLLNGQFHLNFWQLFLMTVGFTLFYRDTQFFGAPTTYIITASGIGIHYRPGHIDYRLFLTFREISRIEKSRYQKNKGWDLFARTREDKDGLLMIPKNPNGFTKRVEKLFIVPKDMEKFMEQLPYGYR